VSSLATLEIPRRFIGDTGLTLFLPRTAPTHIINEQTQIKCISVEKIANPRRGLKLDNADLTMERWAAELRLSEEPVKDRNQR